jgi:hypothetical protein
MKMLAADLKHSLSQFASIANREKKDVVRMAARGFVKDMVAVTPPGSQGSTGNAAKKQGEAAIRRDLACIMVAVKKTTSGIDPVELHKKQFVNGRIRKLKEPLPVDAAKFRALQALLISRVGFLASGWNAMAERLGVSVPAWVKRHGLKAGVVKVIETDTRFCIEGVNETSYVGNVKDYLRRIDKVAGYQASKLDRQCLAILKKAAKRCGFK